MSECIRNDYGVLAVSNEDKKTILKLLNTEFAWDNNSFSVAYPISSAHHLLDKDTVRESISKMKNVITSAPPTVSSPPLSEGGIGHSVKLKRLCRIRRCNKGGTKLKERRLMPFCLKFHNF